MVSNYSTSVTTFELDNLMNWHVSSIISDIKISYELTQEFIVLG